MRLCLIDDSTLIVDVITVIDSPLIEDVNVIDDDSALIEEVMTD